MPPVPLLQPRLCSKCKLLAFPGPQPYKPFSSSLPLRYDDAFTLMPEKMGWGNWWDCFTMAHTTKYLVLDNFPNLPSLKQASRQCEFCEALREILLLKVPKVDSIISNPAFSQRMRGPEPLWITIRAYRMWKNPDMDTIASFSGLHLRVVFDDNLPIEVPRPVIIKWVAEAAPSMGTHTASLHCRLGKLTSLDNEHLHTVLYLQPRQDYIRDSYLRWARGQIAECEKHDHQLADDSFCPERLLDVQGTELRLVAREEAFTAAQIPKYAALSYCWGSTDDDARAQITLTQGSLAQHRLGIRFKRLPLSVQDAVAMTRALSLRYLWVDALCISQDDPADWDRQCVDMHKIYGNAFVTLCAASSQSCRQGFLQPKPEHRILMPYRSSFAPFSGQYCLRLRGAEADIDYASVVPSLRIAFVARDTRHEDFKTDSRWARRGWVFQERASSLRSIVFGKQNLHFVCSKPTKTMNASYSSYEAEIWQRDDAVFSLYRPRGGHTQSEVLDSWLELIQAYSKILPESFTDRSDFLPAISGLAGLYHRYLKASKGIVDAFLDPEKDYIAGYWRQDIPRSILWHLVTNPTATPTLPNYISSLHYQSHELHLPSWSQISRGYTHSILNNKQCGIYPHNPLNNNNNNNNNNFKPEMEILNTHNTTPLGEKNPFGAIRPNPHLHIRTKVLDFATIPDNRRVFSVGSPIHHPHHHHRHRSRVSTEFELQYNLHPLCLVTLDFAPNHNNSHTNQRTLDDDDDDVKSDLLLSRCQLALVGRYSSIDPLGLVLYPILPPPPPPPKTSGGGSPQHQHFYRVGLFTGPGPGDDMSRLYTEQPPASALFDFLAEEREIFLY